MTLTTFSSFSLILKSVTPIVLRPMTLTPFTWNRIAWPLFVMSMTSSASAGT